MADDTSLLPAQLRRIFEAAPGRMLVLRPPELTIFAATESYALITQMPAEQLRGKRFFNAFPDTPNGIKLDGIINLKSSLKRVVDLRISDVLPIQAFPVRTANAHYEERYWNVINSPVLAEDGSVEFIIHRVEDVTSLVRRAQEGGHSDEPPLLSPLLADVLLRGEEFNAQLLKLREQETRLRSAETLLRLGSWEYEVKNDLLHWSPRALEMFGLNSESAPKNFSEYLALVHPDERNALTEAHQAFVTQLLPQITFKHRGLRPDGSVCHVQGVGERHRRDGREIVLGYLQDVTEHAQTRENLRKSQTLLDFAERKARLGGWRVVLGSRRLEWTERTFEIHEYPLGQEPPVEHGVEFYAPEYRERITDAFWACAREGKDYDEICELITYRGNRRWVRSMGSAVRDHTGEIVAVQGGIQDISDFKALEQQAQDADRRRIATLESIDEGFLTLDERWQVSYMNRKAETLLSRARSEMLGKNVWDIFPEAVGSVFQIEYEQVQQTGESRRFQEFFATVDAWFEISAHKVPEGIAIYFRDVTDERVNADHLRLLEHAIARLNDIVLITEAEPLDAPDGPRILFVNDAFERRTGYSRDEVIGKTPRILQGPKTDQSVLRAIGAALRRRESVRAELINYKKSGEEFWLELDIVPLADANGWSTHWVAVERDITERKRSEQALRDSDERFSLMTRATRDVVWDWDLQADTIWWSSVMQEVFGYDPQQLPQDLRWWQEQIHPDDHDRAVASHNAAIQSEALRWQAEYRFKRADGSYASVLDRCFIVRDIGGKALRMLGSMSDLSEHRALEQQLRESQKMEVIGQLTGGVAHDFNNLLTVILANAELLSEQLSDQPSMQENAQMMVHAAERGAELTSRLLAFSRRQALNPKVIDLEQVITQSESLLRRTIPASIDISFALSGELWPVELDAGQLETALMNLVVNARDAMPDGGELTIEASNGWLDEAYAELHTEVEPGPYVVVMVSDSGVGMSADTLRRAFEPFFTTKEIGKGSGLGLSMVFGFVKQSGGHIKVYSEPGEGTSVKMYFRRAEDGTPHDAIVQPEGLPMGNNEHILIVEDDELVREGLATQLRGLGYQVSAAASGSAALALLAELGHIDLLLTDVVMPGGMNGPQLSKEVLQRRPGTPVLFTSGYTENAIVHHGRLDAGVDLLSKPYRRRELALKVRTVLDASERR